MLKVFLGIDVKELIENFSGKGNVWESLDSLINEIKIRINLNKE